MPELPEVQTTVNILNKKIKNLRILDVWTDYNSKFNKGQKNIKDINYFKFFRKEIVGKKILNVERRAKNVLINVSGNRTILVHMKMTGHLLYGKYVFSKGKWFPPKSGPLADPFNRFLHLVFSLSDKNFLALSDMRKFAKIFVFDTDKMNELQDLKKLGPEPLNKKFTYDVFKERLFLKPEGKIKEVLMNQEVIAGIGNIYSDEILWACGIHPLEKVKNIKEKKMKTLYENIGKILKHSLKVGGDSMSDYRNPLGEPGQYQRMHNVYQREGEKCCDRKCKGIVKRIKVGGRSSYFCPEHQKLGR